MKLENTDDQLMSMAAFRYCLGSRSYIVGSGVQWIRNTWAQFESNTKMVILRDIVVAVIDERAGSRCDIDEWVSVARWGYSRLTEYEANYVQNSLVGKNDPDAVRVILGIDGV